MGPTSLSLLDTFRYPLVNVYIAIENGPVEIVDFPINGMGGSFHCYVNVHQRVIRNSQIISLCILYMIIVIVYMIYFR